MINKISKKLYSLSRLSRDLKAIKKAFIQKSIQPILIRIYRKLIGRFIVPHIWKNPFK